MGIEAALSQISGGMMISATFFLIHLVITINPSHRPFWPAISCFIALIIAVSIAVESTGKSLIDAVIAVISNSFVDIIRILPILLLLVFLALLRNSLGNRNASQMMPLNQ